MYYKASIKADHSINKPKKKKNSTKDIINSINSTKRCDLSVYQSLQKTFYSQRHTDNLHKKKQEIA